MTKADLTEIVAEQKTLPGECQVTLVRFDDQYKSVFQCRRIADVPPLQLVPRGWTALYDAIGKTLHSVGARLASTPESERPARVAVVIVTDGCENASKEYTAVQVFDMIKHQREKYSWEFIYMGANHDAYAAAANIGVSNAVLFSAQSSAHVRGSTRSASKAIRSYRAGGMSLNVADVYASAVAEEEEKDRTGG